VNCVHDFDMARLSARRRKIVGLCPGWPAGDPGVPARPACPTAVAVLITCVGQDCQISFFAHYGLLIQRAEVTARGLLKANIVPENMLTARGHGFCAAPARFLSRTACHAYLGPKWRFRCLPAWRTPSPPAFAWIGRAVIADAAAQSLATALVRLDLD